jgi:hypothetical protein
MGLTDSSTAPTGASFTPHVGASANLNISNIEIHNGYFNHLTFYNDIVEEYTTPKTEWEEGIMEFNCSFNNTLNGGNVDSALNSDEIIVKRRVINTSVWVNVYRKAISSNADFRFTIYDPYCRNKTMYEYAIVPVLNGVEGDYYSEQIFSSFDGFYIADKTNLFRVMVNVNYDATDKTEYGLLQPLNSKYPIIINNGITRYNNGTLNCAIMGYKYLNTRKFDTIDIAKMRNDVIDFLNNGLTKVVKDWTGNIAVINKIGDVTRGLNAQTGYSTIGFTWVEQGVANDPKLYKDKELQAIDHIPEFIVLAEEEVI